MKKFLIVGTGDYAEMVFFYPEYDVGQVKLVTVILHGEKGVSLPDFLLKAHMARMTPFY